MANNHKPPTHRVCVTKHYGPNLEKTFYTRIGSAWLIKDGGMSIELNAHPIGNQMVIFRNEEQEESTS